MFWPQTEVYPHITHINRGVKGVYWDSRLHLFEKTISDSDNFEIAIMDSAYEIAIMGF
jgi:hypothetical protein